MKNFKLILFTCLLLSANYIFSQYEGSFPHDAYVIGDDVRIRDASNTQGNSLGKLNFGSHVKVLQQSKNSDSFGKRNAYFWVQIKTEDGTTGWTFGKYVQPVKREAVILTKKKFDFNDKLYQFGYVEIEHNRFMDWDNSEGVSAMMGTYLFFLLENGDYTKVHFILKKSESSTDALDNYWTKGMPCCGADNYYENLHVGGNNIYIGWWEGSHGIDEPWQQDSYIIKGAEDNKFKLTEVKKLMEYKGSK